MILILRTTKGEECTLVIDKLLSIDGVPFESFSVDPSNATNQRNLFNRLRTLESVTAELLQWRDEFFDKLEIISSKQETEECPESFSAEQPSTSPAESLPKS